MNFESIMPAKREYLLTNYEFIRRFFMQFNKSLRSIGVFVILLVVIVAFSGCGGTVSEETKITDVIYSYCQALSDQDWDTARGYCVYDSIAYHEVYDMEEEWNLYLGEIEGIDWDFIVENIDTVTITGEYAEVSGYTNASVIYNGEIVATISSEASFLLQKISSDWKLYKITQNSSYCILG